MNKKLKLIYAGFPGVGKTYATNKVPFLGINVVDSDSSGFSWLEDGVTRNPSFPSNYIEHIKTHMEDGHDSIILTSTHDVVINALIEQGFEFCIVYPNRECKQEYLERYRKRNSPAKFIDLLDESWDKFINSIEKIKSRNVKLVQLQAGECLADVIHHDVACFGE